MLLAIIAFLAAGVVGGALPSNPGWREPESGVAIYLEDNGIHTHLVLPKRAGGIDLSDLAPARDLRDPRFARHGWLAIGWGEAAFFLDTPTWADLRPSTLLFAAVGSSRTLLHIEHIAEPQDNPAAGVRRVMLRPQEYARLVAFVRTSLQPGGRAYPGYDHYDAFYEARGRYTLLNTCNAWTGRGLRQAGVRVGRWTPFPVTVMGWF